MAEMTKTDRVVSAGGVEIRVQAELQAPCGCAVYTGVRADTGENAVPLTACHLHQAQMTLLQRRVIAGEIPPLSLADEFYRCLALDRGAALAAARPAEEFEPTGPPASVQRLLLVCANTDLHTVSANFAGPEAERMAQLAGWTILRFAGSQSPVAFCRNCTAGGVAARAARQGTW